MRLIRPALLIALPLLAAVGPALAARTATALGEAPIHDRPAPDAAVISTLPAGVTVTLEQCTSDVSAAPFGAVASSPGAMAALAPPPPGAFCLLRGLGWVDAKSLGNISADPAALLDGDSLFDPLKTPKPSWDDLSTDDAQ